MSNFYLLLKKMWWFFRILIIRIDYLDKENIRRYRSALFCEQGFVEAQWGDTLGSLENLYMLNFCRRASQLGYLIYKVYPRGVPASFFVNYAFNELHLLRAKYSVIRGGFLTLNQAENAVFSENMLNGTNLLANFNSPIHKIYKQEILNANSDFYSHLKLIILPTNCTLTKQQIIDESYVTIHFIKHLRQILEANNQELPLIYKKDYQTACNVVNVFASFYII